MPNESQSRGLKLLAIFAVLTLIGMVAYYRLVREGMLPSPQPETLAMVIAVVLLIPFVGYQVYMRTRSESEDARILRERLGESPEDRRGRPNYQRGYPLVFRPEWRAPVTTSVWAIMTVMGLIRGAMEVDRRLALALIVGMFVLAGLYIGIRLYRKLVVSWEGVYLHLLTKTTFWPWDQLMAVVLFERRGRLRPGLRLWSLQGPGELISLGGIDFAREELLFDVLIDRIAKAELEIDGEITQIDTRGGESVRELVRELRHEEPEATEELSLLDVFRKNNGLSGKEDSEEQTAWEQRHEPAEAPSSRS